MNKNTISDLTLNPNAKPFLPQNAQNSNICDNNNHENSDNNGICVHNRQQLILNTINLKNISTELTQNRNESKKSDKNSKKPKPTNLTLQTFIAQKLKTDNKSETKANKDSVKSKLNKCLLECPANKLDSSAPSRKRGKEREIPKPKKPTALKKIIVHEKNSHKPEKCDESLSSTDNNDNENNSQLEASDNNTSEIGDTVNYIAKRILHSKLFREYCKQSLNIEIDSVVRSLLTDLVNFQDRLYAKDPIKAGVKRRLCFGFRETSKYAIVNKLKMLIIAPDIEKIETKGGLDDAVDDLLKIVSLKEVPVVFALNRKFLGITCRKKACVSCVGVLNYDGSQENYKRLLVLSENGRNEYNTTYDQLKQSLQIMTFEEIEKIRLELPNISNEFLAYKTKVNSINRKMLYNFKTKT